MTTAHRRSATAQLDGLSDVTGISLGHSGAAWPAPGSAASDRTSARG